MGFKDTIHTIFEVATSPTSYSIYAGVGIVATTVLAIGITKRFCDRYYERVLEKEEFESEPEKPKLKETIKTFAPVLAAAGATLFFMSKTNSAWMDYNSLINGAYVLSQHRLQSFQSMFPTVAGAILLQGLGNKKAEEGLNWYCVKGEGNIPDIYFQSTEADILYAELHTNRNFALRGTSSVGEFFAFLNIPEEDLIAACPTYLEEKDRLGWDATTMFEGGIIPWIDFLHDHIEATEESPWIGQIRFTWPPEYTEDGSFLAYGYYPYPTE